MNTFGQVFQRAWRLLRISQILLLHGLDEIVFSVPLLRRYRFLLALNPLSWFYRPQGSRGERLRRAMEALGPTFIKFGQLLSTRRDLLPGDIADELARLQDAVPPFPSAEARIIIEQSLGRPVAEIFRDFDDTPVAAASIAQVHIAHLHDGQEVAVKIRRPGIERLIEQDLSILTLLADLAERYSHEGRRLRAQRVVAEYAKVIRGELDLLREAANASQLRRNFADHQDLLHVPAVHWDYCSQAVFVMERVYGIPINQRQALADAGADFDLLSRRAAEIFFRQVFENAYFHADMHPGNIFIEPATGRFIAVDFGIMGSLDQDSQHYLAENLVAFLRRDYRRVAEAHVEAGWVPPDTAVQDFEAAIRAIAEPIFERPLNEISIAHLLLRLFQTTRQFNMQTQPQLLLLQKTLVNVEGIARDFNPALNIWSIAEPMLAQWMNRQRGPQGWLRALREQAPKWGQSIPRLPNLLHTVLDQAANGQLQLQFQSSQLELLRLEIRQGVRRLFSACIGSALLIAATITQTQDSVGLAWWDVPVLSWILGGLGLSLLLYAWLQGQSS